MRERLTRLPLHFGPPIAVGLVLGLIGPFGTFDLLPAAPRLAYWLAVVTVNWLLADAIIRRVDAVAGGLLPMARLMVPLVGACLAALPATGVVALANGLSGIGWPENVAVLFGRVLLLLAAIALPVYTWEDMQERVAAIRDSAQPEDDSSGSPRQSRSHGNRTERAFRSSLLAFRRRSAVDFCASRCRTTISKCTIRKGRR